MLKNAKKIYFDMANSILKNEKVIWRCSNTMLTAIYEAISELIKNKKTSQESAIYKFVEKLNQDIYGNGCISIDIADYLKNKDYAFAFAQIFKEAIEQLKKKFEWQEELYNHALELYQLLTISTN